MRKSRRARRFASEERWRDESWRDDRRYAWSAGSPGPGPNHHRLQRNMADAKIAGVCAGVADYFGVDAKLVRIAWVLAAIFFFPPTAVIAYGVATVVLRPRGTEQAYESPEEERFWRNFTVTPKATYGELKHRFRALDARIAEMEHAVTSDEYALRREFRNLEGGAN
ncbi:MAG: envelope stress response membrane protein PspC [Parvularculaceae bacterium]|nr:envelope stress response membrane protein PspC [Parvularculaceae bacterium]